MDWMVSPYNSGLDVEDLVVYDSTLREGEQAPGVTFNKEAKLEIATLLDEMGIPQMDAGFPAVSNEEEKALKEICGQGYDAEILCLARARVEDVDAVVRTEADGVILFVPTSPILLREKLGVRFDEARETALTMVEYAKDHGLFTAITAEDGTRTGNIALSSLFEEAELVGADRVHIADTTGCITPEGMAALVSDLIPEIDIPMGVHCHDDFGLALANTIASVKSGARAVSTTVNGIGERAGNCPTEEFLMAMKVLYGTDLGIKTEKVMELSALVERLSGVKKSPTKAIVGDNVFAHESGIHVSAVLKDPFTYEPFLPEVVGQRRRLVLGKHTGKAAVRKRLEEMGIEVSDDELKRVTAAIKEAAQRGERIDDTALKGMVKAYR